MTSSDAEPAHWNAEQDDVPRIPEPGPARDEGARLRDTMARRLADLLFLPSGQLARPEKALIDSLLVPLFARLDAPEKERLARRVAELRDMPPQLARHMAHEDAAIAGLVLERPDVLDEQDLVAIVKTAGHAHRLSMARRPALTSIVVDELVARGRPEVIEAVLRNPKAQLSRRVFRYFVELSRRDERIPPLLLTREDLPVDIAHELFWYVGSALRWEIVMRFSFERRLMAEALRDLPAEGAAPSDSPVLAVLSVLGLSRPEPAPAEQLGETLARWLRGAEEAQAGPLPRWTGLGAEILARIRDDPWGEPQVVLVKALGAPRNALSLVEEALGPRWAEHERPLRMAHLTRLFDSMSRDWAELLLKIWERNPASALDEFIEELSVNGSSSGDHPCS